MDIKISKRLLLKLLLGNIFYKGTIKAEGSLIGMGTIWILSNASVKPILLKQFRCLNRHFKNIFPKTSKSNKELECALDDLYPSF